MNICIGGQKLSWHDCLLFRTNATDSKVLDEWISVLVTNSMTRSTVSKQTDEIDEGIEPRGGIREGNRGIALFEYPSSPSSELIGPMFSATRTSIGGENVGTDGPTDLYPPVSVEYSVQTAQDPDVLPSEYAAEGGEVWAVVKLDVLEGVLSLEDVWFRSQLLTDSRIYTCDQLSRFADLGVQSRGLVKQGHSANALYQIAENESIDEWGYEEDNRQDVTISRQ